MGMFTPSNNNGGESTTYVPAPQGMHHGRLVSIVDLGHHESVWEGNLKVARTFHLAWELVGTDSGDGKPYIVSKSYKGTDGQWGVYFAKTSGMVKMLRQWLGWDDKKATKPNNLPLAMGQAALIQVMHKPSQDGSKTWANIGGVMPPMPGVPVGEAVTPPLLWSVDDGNVNDLPPFLQNKVAQSYQKQGKTVPSRKVLEAANTQNLDDDIPF